MEVIWNSSLGYLAACVLLLANLLAWTATLFLLPGNWVMVAFAIVYAMFLPATIEPRLSWQICLVVTLLAVVGELVEFIAGAAGTRKKGGSSKSAILSIVGAFVGSLAGAMAGVPIPVIGSAVAAVVGGALGAFAGAYLGEHGKTEFERIEIGKGALVGRLAGTAGKLAVGAVMLVLLTLDSFFDLAG